MEQDTKPTILMASDNASVLLTFARLAAHALPDYAIRVCCYGADVLRYMEHAPVHGVVIDDRMGGMEGLALARTLTKDQAKMPIVLLSTMTSSDNYDAAQRAGCAAVVIQTMPQSAVASLFQSVFDNQYTWQ